MKTDALHITQDARATEEILEKVEQIARYTGMPDRQAINMRLLSEELLAATSGILKTADGSLWMETSEKAFTVHLRVDKPNDRAKREQLISLSKSGKATMPKGLFSRLLVSLEDFLLLDDVADAPMIFTDPLAFSGNLCGMGSAYLYHYYLVTPAEPEKAEPEPVDELAGIEKNVIDAIVDDILVSLQPNAIEIIAVKNLN